MFLVIRLPANTLSVCLCACVCVATGGEKSRVEQSLNSHFLIVSIGKNSKCDKPVHFYRNRSVCALRVDARSKAHNKPRQLTNTTNTATAGFNVTVLAHRMMMKEAVDAA